MTKPMQLVLEYFRDSDGEPWGLFVDGHVDLEQFREAVETHDGSLVDTRDLVGARLGHFYMHRQGRGEYPWQWCEKDARGAKPVTAYRFGD